MTIGCLLGATPLPFRTALATASSGGDGWPWRSWCFRRFTSTQSCRRRCLYLSCRRRRLYPSCPAAAPAADVSWALLHARTTARRLRGAMAAREQRRGSWGGGDGEAACGLRSPQRAKPAAPGPGAARRVATTTAPQRIQSGAASAREVGKGWESVPI